MNTKPSVLNKLTNFEIVGPGSRHYDQAAFGLSRSNLINVNFLIIFPIYFVNIHFSTKLVASCPIIYGRRYIDEHTICLRVLNKQKVDDAQ